jgi:ADP-heptose:LPS heptosyltransferase
MTANESPLISESQLRQAKRLLYMTHLAIGDFIYQGVWLKALKAKYPHLEIDIWFDDCRRKPHSWAAGRNVTLGEWLMSEGDFGELYPIVANLAEREEEIARARARDYDLIVFIGKNRSEQFAKVARQISSSAYIVAARSKPLANALAKWWYFSRLDAWFDFDRVSKETGRVTALYERSFGTVFGLSTEDTGGRQLLSTRVGQAYETAARERIESFVGDDPRRIVFVNHLSTATKKDYPWPQVRTVLISLDRAHDDLAFIVNSPPDQYDDVERLIAEDNELGRLKIMASTAKDSFFELPALMAQCDIVISVDTATTHLAASLDKPYVAIMANDDKLWQPPGDGVILEGTGRAESIAPATVVAAFESLATD